MATPLLIIGDAPSAGTGLGRICGDLATRINDQTGDLYRVGTCGYGGSGSRKFEFPQYHIEGMDSSWVIHDLPNIWRDFAGEEKGIILCIWDLSRLVWLSQPDQFPESFSGNKGLYQWVKSKPFELWGYFPLDSTGPNDRLTFPLMKALLGFDRIIATSIFGYDVICRTINDNKEIEKRHVCCLPHGIDAEVFYPLPKMLCRKVFFNHIGAVSLLGNEVAPIADDEILIGIVATNQSRKDWALGIEAASIEAKSRKVRLWIHTDDLERNWSIPALLVDFGMIDKTVVSLGYISDDKMAEAYSACDYTFGIGPEGFGYCIAESMACGTPCITGSYAAGAELVPKELRVREVEAFHYQGVFTSRRPVYHPKDFSLWAYSALKYTNGPFSLDPKYYWYNLWPRWEAMLREALK